MEFNNTKKENLPNDNIIPFKKMEKKLFIETSYNDNIENEFCNNFKEKNGSTTSFFIEPIINNVNDFCTTFFKDGKSGNLMHLKIFVTGDYDLKNMYLAAAEQHNQKLLNNKFVDAGFDLYTPLQKEDTKEVEDFGEVIRCYGPGWVDNEGFKINPVNKIDFKVKCSAKMYSNFNSDSFYTGYFLFPRSSISKTPLRLANSQGIIDSGYRGNLMGMFDVININEVDKREYEDADYYVKKYDKLVQICAPSLCPIFVEIVNSLDELGEETERGEKGFGSTSTSTL